MSGNSFIERLHAARHSTLLMCVAASQKPMQSASDLPPPPGVLGFDWLGLSLPDEVLGGESASAEPPEELPPVAKLLGKGSDMGDSGATVDPGCSVVGVVVAATPAGGGSPAEGVAAPPAPPEGVADPPEGVGDKDVDGVVGVVGAGDTLGMVGTGVTEGMGDTMGMVAPGDTLGMVEPGDTLGTVGTTGDTLGVVVRKVVIGADSLGLGAAPADERACANAALGNRSQRAMAARTGGLGVSIAITIALPAVPQPSIDRSPLFSHSQIGERAAEYLHASYPQFGGDPALRHVAGATSRHGRLTDRRAHDFPARVALQFAAT
jgi:hypothetical protein